MHCWSIKSDVIIVGLDYQGINTKGLVRIPGMSSDIIIGDHLWVIKALGWEIIPGKYLGGIVVL